MTRNLKQVLEQAAAWWLFLFGAVSIALIVLAFVIPFTWWIIAVFVAWIPMEMVGVLVNDPKYPPLTNIIRTYVPGWSALFILWGLAAAGGSVWNVSFHRPLAVALWFAGVGWLTYHFIQRYNEPVYDVKEKDEDKSNHNDRGTV